MIYSIGVLAVELTTYLTRFDMINVFDRYPTPTSANDKGVLLMRSLLSNYSTMMVNEVHTSV
jgi:hypothetical protein